MKKLAALLLTFSMLLLLAGCDKAAAQQVKTNTDGEYTYYADDSGIVKAKSGGEQSETVVSGVDADNIAVDGADVYYRSKSDGKIYSSDGSTVTDEQIWSFKLVGETFYCVDMQMNLFSLTKSGEKTSLTH